WDLIKAPKDGVSITALSNGDLFALEEAVRQLATKIDRRDFRPVKNWYTGEVDTETEEEEYYDDREMVECFMRNTDWHTERDSVKLREALTARRIEHD